MNNSKAAANYLSNMRADCTTAAGAAVISGLPELGRVLAWIASAPLDKLRGMRYTDIIKQHAQRAEKQEGKTMKTYTRHEYAGYDIYVSDDTSRVHHAVKINTTNPTTLYPYEPCKTGGLDNACDCYTLQQVKNRMKTGKIVFR